MQKNTFDSNKKERNKKFDNKERVDDVVKDEVLQVRRVSTKRAGGSSFHFSVLCVAGDYNGRVGVGLGKSLENTNAIAKAKLKARRSLKTVYITEKGSVPHESMVKNGSSIIFIKPAPEGAGVIAGGSVRRVLELAGYKNISVKIIGSSNPINNANTLIDALRDMRPVSNKKDQKVVVNEKIEESKTIQSSKSKE